MTDESARGLADLLDRVRQIFNEISDAENPSERDLDALVVASLEIKLGMDALGIEPLPPSTFAATTRRLCDEGGMPEHLVDVLRDLADRVEREG